MAEVVGGLLFRYKVFKLLESALKGTSIRDN